MLKDNARSSTLIRGANESRYRVKAHFIFETGIYGNTRGSRLQCRCLCNCPREDEYLDIC